MTASVIAAALVVAATRVAPEADGATTAVAHAPPGAESAALQEPRTATTAPPEAPWFCGGPTLRSDAGSPRGGRRVREAEAPSRDLFCVELLPTDRARSATGTLQLSPAASPFGAPLTRDGRLRYRISLRLRGLPPPGRVGEATTYVAWAAAPTLRPMVRLGEVGEGLHHLRSVDLNKFLVLVTAERTADVEKRRGPVVLRARSPSMRLQPHDVPFAFMRGEGDEAGAAGEDGAGASAGRLAWTPPAMHPRVPMSPPVSRLRPPGAPFLPSPLRALGAADRRDDGAADATPLPRARPRDVVRMEDGDTLRLTARRVRRSLQGRTHVMYGFNAQYPGPLIRVPRGAAITVRFHNEIELPSTIHWHGIRIENRFDGVPGVTQEPVPPGGSFTYRVRFPDAGLYWYHPHVREDVQQDLGLYGNMLVEPRPGGTDAGPSAGLRDRPAGEDFTYGGHFAPVNREEVLMLDDLLLDGRRDADGPRLVPYGESSTTHALMGRFGNLFLVNGEPGYRLQVTRGEVVRFYLTNVANARTFNLSFGDLPVKVVASDLSRYERPVRTENVVMGPAERYVVEVRFDEAGTVPLLNRVQGINHVYGNFFSEVDTLGRIRVEPGGAAAEEHRDAFASLPENPEVIRDVGRYRDAFDRPVGHTLHLTMEADSLPFPVGSLMRRDSLYFHPVEATGTMPRMNWVATSDRVRWILRDPATGRENMEIDWRFRVGDVTKVRLRNLRDAAHAMQHPIHIHGQRFLVLSRNGRRNDNLVWKDTTIVPVGTTATLLLELTNPGEWMIHCHVAEHLNAGMRTTFTVEPSRPPSTEGS